MTVVKFPSRPASDGETGWGRAELERLTGPCAAYLVSGHASAWELGKTECGDPQLYLLGPAPEQECILTISRLGSLYIVEDGNARIIFEHDNLSLFAERAAAALRNKRQVILAQVALAWCAMRELFEEKVEPVLAEPMEVISHLAPQLATLV